MASMLRRNTTTYFALPEQRQQYRALKALFLEKAATLPHHPDFHLCYKFARYLCKRSVDALEGTPNSTTAAGIVYVVCATAGHKGFSLRDLATAFDIKSHSNVKAIADKLRPHFKKFLIKFQQKVFTVKCGEQSTQFEEGTDLDIIREAFNVNGGSLMLNGVAIDKPEPEKEYNLEGAKPKVDARTHSMIETMNRESQELDEIQRNLEDLKFNS